jgi:hypothetical protein
VTVFVSATTTTCDTGDIFISTETRAWRDRIDQDVKGYREIELSRTSSFIAKLAYTTKLRAKQYKADASIFHRMMIKGCSVHLFALKGESMMSDWKK